MSWLPQSSVYASIDRQGDSPLRSQRARQTGQQALGSRVFGIASESPFEDDSPEDGDRTPPASPPARPARFSASPPRTSRSLLGVLANPSHRQYASLNAALGDGGLAEGHGIPEDIAEEENEDDGPPASIMYEAPRGRPEQDDRPVLRSPGASTPSSSRSPQLHAHFPNTLPRPERTAFSPDRSLSPSPPPSFTEEDQAVEGPEQDVEPPTNDNPSLHESALPPRRSPQAAAAVLEAETGLRVGGDKGKGRAAQQDEPSVSHQRRTQEHLPEPVTMSRPHEGLSRKDRALWRWVNVSDLDAFLISVYAYYEGKGVWNIALTRLLGLLTIGFVIFFSTWLIGCIDYSIIRHRQALHEVVVPQCFSHFHGLSLVFYLLVLGAYAYFCCLFTQDMNRLWEMHEFFTELLEIPASDVSTYPWHVLAARLSALRAEHPAAISSHFTGVGSAIRTTRLDAHDIANRIMRQENYLIALFNRNLLNLELEVNVGPFGRKRVMRGQLTRVMERALRFCVLQLVFGPDGQIRHSFLYERNRRELIEALRRRFVLTGTAMAIFSVFVLPYVLVYSFFRYFEEYRTNPSSIGSRNFTQLARAKFREYNELSHHFAERLYRAYEPAQLYVDQFPRATTAIIARFVAFIAGSFAAVLLLFTLLDPDAFLKFELTEGRTVIFYLGVLTAILAVARGMVPEGHRAVNPEELMREVVEHTHYLPDEWRGRLHSIEVNKAFGQLFQVKILTFAHEIISVVTTPFLLWRSLPDSAPAIIDFFREFTVHVDGLGYVCSFAEFNFQRHGDVKYGAPVQGRDRTDGKMERSLLGFKSHHPDWNPHDQTTSLYLSNMASIGPQLISRTARSSSRSVMLRPGFASTIGSPPFTAHGGHSNHGESIALADPYSTATARGRENKAKFYDRAFAKAAGPRLRNQAGNAQRLRAENEAIEAEGYVGTLLEEEPSGTRAMDVTQEPQSLLSLIGQANKAW